MDLADRAHRPQEQVAPHGRTLTRRARDHGRRRRRRERGGGRGARELRVVVARTAGLRHACDDAHARRGDVDIETERREGGGPVVEVDRRHGDDARSLRRVLDERGVAGRRDDECAAALGVEQGRVEQRARAARAEAHRDDVGARIGRSPDAEGEVVDRAAAVLADHVHGEDAELSREAGDQRGHRGPVSVALPGCGVVGPEVPATRVALPLVAPARGSQAAAAGREHVERCLEPALELLDQGDARVDDGDEDARSIDAQENNHTQV